MKPKEFSQTYFHGSKAKLSVGEHIVPGNNSNYSEDLKSKYTYFTSNLMVAAWGAELAAGEGPVCIYVVEPLGGLEDDPNVTNKKFPGNPTNSYRSTSPLVVLGIVHGWVGHSKEEIEARIEGLKQLMQNGAQIIE